MILELKTRSYASEGNARRAIMIVQSAYSQVREVPTLIATQDERHYPVLLPSLDQLQLCVSLAAEHGFSIHHS